MKKLLSLALVFVLVLTMLTSCDILSNLFQPQAQYNLAGAAEYLDGLYKEDLSKTPVDYKVVAQVKIDDVVYTVEWTVDTDKVTVGAAENGLVNIDVDEKSAEEVKYVLTATIKAPDGTSTTKQYTVTVPKYEAMSWEDYIAAAAGDLISEVSGVVTGIVSKSEGSGYNCFFMQDATGGGYYIYGMTEDPIADLGIAVGMTVTVAGGVKDIYNGTHEIKPSEQGLKITIDSKEITPVTPMDYTEIFKNAADLKDIALVEKQSSLVTIKGVEISGQALDNGYLYFKLDGKEAYLRISSSTLGFPTANKEAFIAEHAEKRGYIADVTGIISVYSGAFYLVPVSVDAFAYGALAEKTPEQKAQEALDILEIPTVISKNTELVLPATSDVYEGVTFEWVCNSDNFAIVDGKVNVVLGAAADTLKLTATATCGDKTAVKEFTIEVSANVVLSTTKPYIPSLFQAKLDGGKTLYLDGTFGERYLNTTEDITKAVAVYAELAEGGYKFYILVDGAKNYVYLYKNDADKDSVKFDAANANVFSYNAAVNAWVTNFNNTEYYLGAYNTYNTVSCSRLSYINAENTGIEQFPLEYNIVAEGVALNGTLFQAKLDGGKTLYLDGTFGERYLNTTEDITKAVAIYAEKAEDGYKFYILVDGAKNYVYLYKNDADKSAVKFDAENANVFKFDGATNAWVTVYDGGDYYLGTYNTYNTVSSSKTSYINAENTGVEQFPLNYIIATGTPSTPDQGGNGGNEEPSFTSGLEIVDTPVVGTEYYFGLAQVNKETDLYITGTMSGFYYATTSDKAASAKVVLEAVAEKDGVYYLSTTANGAKKYLNIVKAMGTDGKEHINVVFEDAAVSEYVYNTEYKTVTTNIGEDTYYFGTYGTYTTFSASKIDKAATSFVAHFCVAPATPSTPDTPNTPSTPSTPDTPAVDAPAIEGSLATFSFGANGEATHADGNSQNPPSDGVSFTSGNYTLTLTNVSKVFDGAFDAKGNSCLKLGSSNAVATFSFTVGDDVNKVVIRVAAYKAKTTVVIVNGTEYDVSANKSNDGSYFEIVIDTTTNKTVDVATKSGACRAMVDAIAYFG